MTDGNMTPMVRIVCLIIYFVPVATFSQVVLSEIMFDPAYSEQTDEFVEIVNLSDDPVDLSGWRIGDGIGDDALVDAGEGMTVLPGQHAVILDADYFDGSTTYDGAIPEDALVLSIDGTTFGSGGLSNSQPEYVTLSDAIGRVIAQVLYSTGNEPGHSDEKIDLAGSDDAENWADSERLHGTPGFRNSVALLDFDLAVGRITVEPVVLDVGTQATLTAGIVNEGKEAASDFRVTFFEDVDKDSVPDAGEEIGVFEHDGILESGDSTEVSTVWIVPAPGRLTIGVVIDFPEDERSENNLRLKEIAVGFSAGSLMINEIMYDPPTGQPEWVEIVNPGGDPVDLSGWMVSDEDGAKRTVITDQHAVLVPDDFIVVSEDSSVIDYYPGCEDVIIVRPFPNLNNDGDSVVLYDLSGKVIDAVGYRSGWGGEKVSLERIHPSLASSDSSNWSSCVALEGGTPGRINSIYTSVLPTEAALDVAPNPFSPDGDGFDDFTVISYRLPMRTSRINLRVFDVNGRLIRTLRGASPSGAEGSVVWDGRDDSGQRTRMGIYIVHIEGIEAAAGVLASAKTTVVLAGGL